jgi:hypothetical protein
MSSEQEVKEVPKEKTEIEKMAEQLNIMDAKIIALEFEYKELQRNVLNVLQGIVDEVEKPLEK